MKVCSIEGNGNSILFGQPFALALVPSAILAILCFGCGQRNSADLGTKSGLPAQEWRFKITSTSELQTILVRGMNKEAILARLGEPDFQESATRGVVWKYQLAGFPVGTQAPGTRVIGLTLSITNDRLAAWGFVCVGSQTGGKSPETRSLSRETNSLHTSLHFFVVSPQPVDKGRFVSTRELPNLGYIANEPDLLVDKLTGVTEQERLVNDSSNQVRKVWRFACTLAEKEAAQFEALTRRNVDHRLLIMADGEPVVAPLVLAPVEGGRFEIECEDASLAQRLRDRLSSMVNKESQVIDAHR